MKGSGGKGIIESPWEIDTNVFVNKISIEALRRNSKKPARQFVESLPERGKSAEEVLVI
jgi:hypothetical protein